MSAAMRVADVDRDRTVDRLRRAAAEGRLEPDELEQRVEAALRSRTETDLKPLTEDLPSERRSRRQAEFHTHRLVFVLVGLGMIAIWALCGGGYFWPMWPILGWGSGLFFHGRAVVAGR